MAYGQFEQFIRNLTRVMSSVNTKLQRDLTMRSRVSRRFSMTEAAEFLGVDATYLTRLSADEAMFPDGERSGRSRTFSPDEIMLIRAIMASNPNAKRSYLHWRKPGDPLKVVTFGAQKGGTGKSLTASHFAQYLNLFYGLRVGVIDADPQATASLYFADETLPLFKPETHTMAEFMGVDDPGAERLNERNAEELDAIWQKTPWPGIRLIPGGANIQNGDISLFMFSRRGQIPVYRILKDAIARWDEGLGPRSVPSDFRKDGGAFDHAAYEAALTETVDVIVIDQQPSLTLVQLNGLIAADNVVIPQTMKGFDLATLSTYVSNIGEYLEFILSFEPDIEIGRGEHVILPTIVQEQNDQDTDQILDLYRRAPREILQVWYTRSDAIANASEEYKSIYEYLPPASRRTSARTFMRNANAVNDALVQRVLPDLPKRDFADTFIKERWS
ncbi:AAA family ATPase [Profundibacterium mesophilum]|uniref:Replication protein A n=1 Tax=Profundibacterium mesophilum KAUST100406-0324 TaxID=1037889 RepID=A0A921NPJ3_9RHOB|nr:ParA family protein [Profundibacterium mesophilum]KAF0674690.1 Replication protein A [Profundibacterium mesophilum KAUST100406-0324]